MAEAYIVAAMRTATGRKQGRLRQWHPGDLGAHVLDEMVQALDMDPALIDDVIFGCVSQVGAQSGNVARYAVLASSLPESVPGTTVDRQCGSSQQALHFAIQAVMSGTQDIVIAGGVEVMSQVPIGASIVDGYKAGHGAPGFAKGVMARYPNVQFNQFMGAEMIAKQWGMTRDQLDAFAVRSHARAALATEGGWFAREIVPVTGHTEGGDEVVHLEDEGIRRDCTFQGLSGLKLLREDGMLTAGTSSQIADGASAVMVVNEEGLKKLGVPARARVVALALAGTDPVTMLTGPIPATQNALARAGMSINDMDMYEVNEAFAPVPLAWATDVGADHAKLNVSGGAIALGHPLGATGTKLMTTLVHGLEREQARYGLQAICEGGGTANATIIERA